MELFDCSPLKNVKPDRTLQIGKRKISKVTNAFGKAVAIALDEPALGQSTDCLHCCQLVEQIKEKLAITENREEIIQLLTIVFCDLSISKVAEVFNISEYTAREACELRLRKGILSMLEQKQRAGTSQETKQTVLAFYESQEVSCLLPGKKQENWLFNICALTSEVVHPCCCCRYTQCLCFHLSPKCKTHAGSNEFFFQLQTNNEVVCT